MAKNKNTELARVDDASQSARTGEVALATQEQWQGLAIWMGMDLSLSASARTERAVQAYSEGTRLFIETGIWLASLHAEVGADSFIASVEERGISKQRAYELMRGAALVARVDLAKRERLMALPKSKVGLLANASPAIVEALLSEGEVDVSQLSWRDMRAEIRSLEERLTNAETAREEAELARTHALSALERKRAREDGLPAPVADARLHVLADGETVRLALEGMGEQLAALTELLGGPGASAEMQALAQGSLRLAAGQVCALLVQAEGLLGQIGESLGGELLGLDFTSRLSPQERQELAAEFARELSFQQLSREHRALQAKAKRQTGRGRPIKVGPAPEREGV